MTATSVTGRGTGSADRKNKGSEHNTLGVGHLIGPRVVMAGTATLSGGGVFEVRLPLLAGVATDYVVHLTATGGAVTIVPRVSTVMSFASGDTKFTITGDAAAVIYWTIVKKGL